MPQFELAPNDKPSVFVRARAPQDALTRHLGDEVEPADLVLGDAEAGTGWRAVVVNGEPWGRIRPRDRMRFRRD